MELGVYERIVLLGILPKEGDFTTLKIVRGMREDLSFSEEEHKALEFVQDGSNIQWKKDADVPRNINFGEKATDLIVETLKKLDEQKKLKEEYYSLYEKFVGG